MSTLQLRFAFRLSVANICFFSSWLMADVYAGPKLVEEYHYDFKGGGDLPPVLEFFGPNCRESISTDEQGARFFLPAGRKSADGGGISCKFAVCGDFQITLAYEILQVTAAGKKGCGALIWISHGASEREAASWARHEFSKDAQPAYQVYRRSVLYGGKSKHSSKEFPTRSTIGQLRLVREGRYLHFSSAEGLMGDFHEFFKDEFGEGDLSILRFAASPGSRDSILDLRFLGIEIRAEKLTGAPRPESKENNLLWYVIWFGALTVVVVVVGVILRKWIAWKKVNRNISTLSSNPRAPASES